MGKLWCASPYRRSVKIGRILNVWYGWVWGGELGGYGSVEKSLPCYTLHIYWF